jgi:hypothetical protein
MFRTRMSGLIVVLNWLGVRCYLLKQMPMSSRRCLLLTLLLTPTASSAALHAAAAPPSIEVDVGLCSQPAVVVVASWCSMMPSLSVTISHGCRGYGVRPGVGHDGGNRGTVHSQRSNAKTCCSQFPFLRTAEEYNHPRQ